MKLALTVATVAASSSTSVFDNHRGQFYYLDEYFKNRPQGMGKPNKRFEGRGKNKVLDM